MAATSTYLGNLIPRPYMTSATEPGSGVYVSHWFVGPTSDGIDTGIVAQGFTPYTSTTSASGSTDINWYVNGVDTGIIAIGTSGHTPVITIGENGNWYVDNVDTAQPAQGPAGTGVEIQGSTSSVENLTSMPFAPGYAYLAGADWDDPTPIGPGAGTVVKSGDLLVYTGTSSGSGNPPSDKIDWSDVGNIQGPKGNDGDDGLTPYITSAGTWFTSADTGLPSQGYTPYIQDGEWYINGESTGTSAQGQAGEDGTNGFSPTINSTSGTWVINGDEDTDQLATPAISFTMDTSGNLYFHTTSSYIDSLSL